MTEFVQSARFEDEGLANSYRAFEMAVNQHNSGKILFRAPLLSPSNAEQLRCAQKALDTFKTLKIMSPSPLFEPNGDIGGLWALGGFCVTWQALETGIVLWACSEGATIKSSGQWDINKPISEGLKQALIKIRNRQKSYQQKVNKVSKATKNSA